MAAFGGGIAGYTIGKTYSTGKSVGKVAGKGVVRFAKSGYSALEEQFRNLNG